MTTTDAAPPTFRRAVLLMTVTSFLVPAAGVITSPVLARALSTQGRGELAAALAPAGLMLAVATLGLPDALTYHLAKRPGMTRPALLWATVITTVLGVLCLLATWLALPFLSAGDASLRGLILLATAITVPALVVGAFRGAATGRQMWGAVAAERLVNTVLRLVSLVGLWLAGDLTVLVAVLVSGLTPVVAGVAYWRLLLPPPGGAGEASRFEGGTLKTVVSFGSRVWLGSVASMFLDRADQLFMAPLSSVADLGLFTVAGTISDLPLIVALAIQGALYGVDSKDTDSSRLTRTTRVTLLVGTVGCVVLGASLPLWVGPLFGSAFTAATVPTLLLLLSAVICIPGIMASSGVATWGRPGLRSIGLAVTLVTNLTVFVLLVPVYGVYGGCWASIVTNVVMTGFMVLAAHRVIGVPVSDFLVPRWSDARLAWSEGLRLVRRLLRGRPRDPGPAAEPSAEDVQAVTAIRERLEDR